MKLINIINVTTKRITFEIDNNEIHKYKSALLKVINETNQIEIQNRLSKLYKIFDECEE